MVAWSVGDHFGFNFGDLLVYFCVFPCVFSVFHMKINVFPRVYEDLTLRFFGVFGKGDFTSF